MSDRHPSPPAPSSGATLRDVEELSDLYVHRPLAARVVPLLLGTPVTPNQVTVASGIAGIAAGIALAASANRPALRLASAGLLFASTILDCCDGQLARAKQRMSPNGAVIDAAADVVVAISMVLAVAFAVVTTGGSPRIWILAVVALGSYAVQCFLFDVAKEQFLATHGLSYASSKASHARAQPSAGARSPVFDLYWGMVRPVVVSGTATSRARIGRGSMRLWTVVGQGTHMTCLYVAAAAAYAWLPALYTCLLVFAVGMNIVVAALVVSGASPFHVRG